MVGPALGPVVPVPERWCIGFTDLDPSAHWLRRVLARLVRPPRHVLAFRDTPGGLLIVQGTLGPLMVTIQPGASEASFTAEIEEAGGRVVAVVAPPNDGQVGWLPKPFSCVDIVRALTSARWRPQTPRGLLRELTR